MDEIKETNNQEQKPTTTGGSVFDALQPSSEQPAAGAEARIAELERELQSERVERGRLRTANDEVRQLKEEIARLKAENANLSARKPGEYLTEDERKMLDPEQLAVVDKVIRGRMGDVTDKLRAESEKSAAREGQYRKAQFDAEVERLAPGLAALVNEHRDDWNRWAGEKRRMASVTAAFKSFDAATVAEFLNEFVSSKGIRAEGDGVAARPETSYSPRGGNRPVTTGKDTATYTLDQYNTEIRKATADYEAGRITLDQRKAIQSKFDTALAEGRVVRQ